MEDTGKIPGGYILQPRTIESSWVAHAAPIVRETWAFLLRKANHSEQKYNGFVVKRGQLFISYSQIRDALSWHVGFRIQRYTENQMKHTMKLLRIHHMIELTSQPRGNVVTICNYDYYQNPSNYESTNESTNELTNGQPRINQSSPAINKNVKKERMKELPYAEIVGYLNAKTGKSYRSGKATKTLIRGRFGEGASLDDFKTVIDAKVKDWLGDAKMEQYLRPSTLFSASKFDEYRNSQKTNNPSGTYTTPKSPMDDYEPESVKMMRELRKKKEASNGE